MVDQADEAGAAVREGSRHVVVAFPGYHRSWATWLAGLLAVHGHRTTLQRWDPARDQPLEEALGDLLLASGRVLLVLSDWFFQLGPRREGEWNTVLRDFVAPRADRFAAVNLTHRGLPPATAVLEPVDLWSVDEDEAERRLLARLGIEASPHEAPAGPGTRFPNDPVAVWGEVPRRNGSFTGRDELLNEVQQRLMEAGRGAAACTLVGMSGIGKTQIAAEYAHRFSPDYDVVWWINSDQRNTLRDGLGELAVELGLTDSSETGERIRSVREALRRGSPYERWLLVFDGWDDVAEAEKYLPPGGRGHVLITSRNRSWGARTELMDVRGFERQESTGYLMRRAPHLTGADADRVAAEFDDVPIQLAQAAAWLGESRMEAGEYLRMVRTAGARNRGPVALLEGLPQSTYTSWSILLNKLRATEPHAVELLTLCAAFAPGRIPLGLAGNVQPGDLPEGLRWITSDRRRWARAMDTLVNYSVLTRHSRGASVDEGGPEQESVHMHRVVHGIVGQLTAGDDTAAYRRAVRRMLAAADPGSPADSRNWARYAELMPHLEPSGILSSRDYRSQDLLLKCVRYCDTSGEYRAGAELAERIREHWSAFMSPQEAPLLELTTRQGNILRGAGRFGEARELDTARLASLSRLDSAPEEALLRAKSCLAADQRFLGQYAEALENQQEVVATAERLFGPDEWITLLARHNLGGCLRLLGRYREAYEVDLDTYRKREALLRSRHPDTLNSSNTCTRDLRLMGRYQEALARQELGVRRHVQVLGPRHPGTLWARHSLAMCKRRAGTTKGELGAELASLLEAQVKSSGRGHYGVLSLIADYGNYQREHGDLAEAKALITEAEDGYRALLGQAHPVPTGMQSNAGLILQAEGDRDGALNMFEQARVGLSTLLGDDHPATLGCALNAAGGRNFTGRLAEAEALSRDTLRRSRQSLGDDHPLTLSCQVALAADLRSLQERTEAGKLEDDALQRLTRTLGAQHPHTLAARQRNRPYWDFEPYLG
jgi:tetratricopeptide (TPR) repeat protein